ncbi:MAG TPA: PEP/pyruvate-binding domain-containing protein [Solirubrobacterales bacterium]
MSVVTLDQGPPRSVCGGKFTGLVMASKIAPVPRALCLTVDEFGLALGPHRLRSLARLMEDVRSTVGAFLPEAEAEVAKIFRGVSPTPSQIETLLVAVDGTWGRADGFWLAVRSSAVDEDAADASGAGIYASVLGVETPTQLADAIAVCWRSFYGPAALAARVRAGDFDPAPRMAVVVQQMVEPAIAGVAFTDGDEVTVEYVRGRADGLVAGADVPARVVVDCREEAAREDTPTFLRSVCTTAQRLREATGDDVDVEWAWDASIVAVLQCRPVAARVGAERWVAEPHLAYCRLYLDDIPSDRFSLGAAAPIWASYVAKRSMPYRLARKHRMRTGEAFAVSLNGAALVGEGARGHLRPLLDELTAKEVVIDVAPTIRQVVADRDDLLGQLRTLLRDADSAKLQGCIVRDFLRGSHGALSLRDGQGRTLVELSHDGLLALNRGTALTSRIYIPDGETAALDGEAPEEVRSALPGIVDFTRALDDVLPGVQLEWVIDDRQAVFVDYSAAQSEVPDNAADGVGAVVSGGMARGPVLEIGNDALLERLSIGPAVSVDRTEDVLTDREFGALFSAVRECPEKPIVVASAPYAALSVLIDWVAGFVFERGAVLSHLGILLREARLPAIIHPDPPRSGTAVIADGSLSVIVDGAPS